MSKKSIIVPGVHDLVPPQGMVTVQLTDPDRPWRIKKEVKAENTVMDWWLSALNPGLRSDRTDDVATNMHGTLGPMKAQVGTSTPNVWTRAYGGRPGHWPGFYGNYMQWFWASGVNAVPDSSKPWIPCDDTDNGNLVGYSSVDITAAPDVLHPRRGTLVASDSFLSWDRCRMAVEWGTTQGNGVWRSAGIGNVMGKYQTDAVVPLPFFYTQLTSLRQGTSNNNYNKANTGESGTLSASGAQYSAHHDGSGSAGPILWTYTSAGNISSFDLDAWDYVTGTTYEATGFSGRGGITYLNNKVWCVNGTNLYEIDPDISGGVTIDNTFDLTVSISGDSLLDITTDGTDLYIQGTAYVHKVNNVGVYTSGWAHGQTLVNNTGNLEYDPNMDHLWFSTGTNTNSTTGSHQIVWGDWDPPSSDRSWEDEDNYFIKSFSKTGVAQPYVFKHGLKFNNDVWGVTSGVTGMDPQGWVALHGSSYTSLGQHKVKPFGPTAATHANLGSDVVKSATEALKVIYDFDYT